MVGQVYNKCAFNLVNKLFDSKHHLIFVCHLSPPRTVWSGQIRGVIFALPRIYCPVLSHIYFCLSFFLLKQIFKRKQHWLKDDTGELVSRELTNVYDGISWQNKNLTFSERGGPRNISVLVKQPEIQLHLQTVTMKFDLTKYFSAFTVKGQYYVSIFLLFPVKMSFKTKF